MKTPVALAGLLVAGVLFAQETPAAPAPLSVTVTAPEEFLSIPTPGRFRNFFQPFRTDTAALSPDGKFIAYSVRDGENLSVAVVEADHPEKLKASVLVGTDTTSTAFMARNQYENTPARITWMRWSSPTRLVVETNRVFATGNDNGGWASPRGAVLAFDADGGNARLLVRPQDIPLPASASTEPGDNRLSVARDLRAPITGTWSASDPVPSNVIPEPGDIAPVNPIALVSALATATPDVAGASALRVFDLDPEQPGAVNLTVTSPGVDGSNQRISFFSLDTASGKLNQRTFDFVLGGRDALLDRQGRIRMTLPNSPLSSLPFNYAYRGPKGEGRDRPFGASVGLTGFTVAPDNFFGARAIPLGFDHDPDVLYYADNTGRDTYGIYSLNLTTKQRGRLVMENPAYDLIAPPMSGFGLSGALVFDRYDHQLAGVRYDNALRSTAWVKPELKGLQAWLEQSFPGRSVAITDWDESRRRFLIATEGPADAGAFYLLDRDKNQLKEFARRAPWIDAKHTHPTLPFSYAASDGTRLTGLVTVPRQPHLEPIPMIVLCPAWPWQRVNSDFSTEVQALADMGFVVMQLNGRGVWGLGLKHRQALTAGYDAVQVEDLAGSIGQLQKIFRINPARVALIGFGHGGFIALRALQAHPDKFRCAIALDAPVDLGAWLKDQEWTTDNMQAQLTKAWLGDAARLAAAPLARQATAIKKPILVLNYPGPDGTARNAVYRAARQLSREVGTAGVPARFGDLSTDYMRGLPQARADVFGQIEEFLNVNVYDFNVKLHEFKVVEQ